MEKKGVFRLQTRFAENEGKMGRATELSAVEYVPTENLVPNPRNSRVHSKRQIQQIARSIGEFGFNNPILINREGIIAAGHGRWAAAKLKGLERVPTLRLDHLTPDRFRAYVIADNKLAELAQWDKATLAIELQELMEAVPNLELSITGFEIPEIDLILQGEPKRPLQEEKIDVPAGPPVCRLGDIWQLGRHIVSCGDALKQSPFDDILNGKLADFVFTDPPYNVPIDGHVSGKGSVRHREFPMASGEMDDIAFTTFLAEVGQRLITNSQSGSLHYICMDWSHIGLLLNATKPLYSELKNICVWVKSNGGMGSLYRSRHELIAVFKNGSGRHLNNVQLGRFGRNRTNVWEYPTPSAFGRPGEEGYLAALHPTVKPVVMVADAILDSSPRQGLVLDPFLGSGTTLIAAERVGRVCCAIELDPLYVDVAVRRWQRYTGGVAVHTSSGRRFDDCARGSNE